ncbi:hypothetical protein [Desulfobacter hydrogenophilus]|nr:hypothetical protein [Desulfobacter hydrogenophilus]
MGFIDECQDKISGVFSLRLLRQAHHPTTGRVAQPKVSITAMPFTALPTSLKMVSLKS